MVVRIQKTLRKVFPLVDLYTSVVPIYAGYWPEGFYRRILEGEFSY